MPEDFIELINEFLAYNSFKEKPIRLKEYLIKELNYTEEDAEEINALYNRGMLYS